MFLAVSTAIGFHAQIKIEKINHNYLLAMTITFGLFPH